MDAPQRFRFREEVLHRAASRTRRRLLASVAATAAAVTAVWATALRDRGAGTSTLVLSLALLGALALLSLRRRLGRLRARWASFEVRLEAEAVLREIEGHPTLRIARAEVAEVSERPEGVVVRDRAGRALLVPREVDGYERAREALSAWGPAAHASP